MAIAAASRSPRNRAASACSAAQSPEDLGVVLQREVHALASALRRRRDTLPTPRPGDGGAHVEVVRDGLVADDGRARRDPHVRDITQPHLARRTGCR